MIVSSKGAKKLRDLRLGNKEVYSMLEPVKKQTVTENIVQQIKKMIETGEFKIGEKLPSERELVQTLSVSRIAVREAIKGLAALNLVEVRPGEGTFVKAVTSKEFVDSFDYTLLLERSTFRELLETRRFLEVELAGLAAERATPEDLDAMKKSLEAMKEDLSLGRDYLESDVSFHNAIIEASGNNILNELLNNIADLLRESRRKTMSVQGAVGRAIEGHMEIYEKVKARDPHGARQAMLNHLYMVEKDLATYQEELRRSHNEGK